MVEITRPQNNVSSVESTARKEYRSLLSSLYGDIWISVTKKAMVIRNAAAICARVPGEMKMIKEHNMNFLSSSATSHQYAGGSYEA